MTAVRIPNVDENGNFLNPNVKARLQELAGGGSSSTATPTSGLLEQLAAIANRSPTTDIPGITVTQGNTAPISGNDTGHDTNAVRTIGVQPREVSLQTRPFMDNGAVGAVPGGGGKPYTFEFITTDAEVAFKMGARGATPRFWVMVDGHPVGFAPQEFDATANEPYWAHLVFPEARKRTIRVGMDLAAFGGVVSVTGVTPPPATEVIRAAFVGDSWFAGAPHLEGGWPYTMAHTAAGLLGWDVLNAGLGSTGYVQGTTYGAQARVDAVVGFAPHYIVVWGSINDKGHAPATVRTAAANLYAAYAARLPHTKVIVVGPQPAPAGGAYTTDTALQGIRDAVQTAALAATNVIGFVDPIAGRWVTGTGSITEPAGDGNADYYIATDKIHPSRLGGPYFGRRLTEEVVRALAVNGVHHQEWDGPTIPNPNDPNGLPDLRIFADDFERTSANVIGENTPVGGKTWATSTPSATLPITDGVAKIATAATDIHAYVNGGTADGVLTADVATVGPGGTGTGLLFRMSNNDNYLHLRPNTGLWQLVKRVAGSVSIVDSDLGPAADGDVLTVTLNGSSVTIAVNGTEQHASTITDHTTNTLYGLRGTTTTSIGLDAIELSA